MKLPLQIAENQFSHLKRLFAGVLQLLPHFIHQQVRLSFWVLILAHGIDRHWDLPSAEHPCRGRSCTLVKRGRWRRRRDWSFHANACLQRRRPHKLPVVREPRTLRRLRPDPCSGAAGGRLIASRGCRHPLLGTNSPRTLQAPRLHPGTAGQRGRRRRQLPLPVLDQLWWSPHLEKEIGLAGVGPDFLVGDILMPPRPAHLLDVRWAVQSLALLRNKDGSSRGISQIFHPNSRRLPRHFWTGEWPRLLPLQINRA
mmetsp:Transcript_60385/g.125211  ORF Transcript_60385/g.125211 Transcript_60385/m.125211 type:complete len:255 (-) Transcript_60385:252-1016(-)